MNISLTQKDHRWWFVDTEGRPFVSLGANHLQSDCWLAPYNREWMLERYGSDLADEQNRFNPAGNALPKLVTNTLNKLQDVGFNSLGMHTYDVPVDLYDSRMFHLRAIEMFPLGTRYRFASQRFPDIFSDEFASRLEQHILELLKTYGQSKGLMGWVFSDIPRWYFYGNGGRGKHVVHPWVKDLADLPPGSPGQLAVKDALGHTNPETEADSDRVLQEVVRQWVQLHASLLRRHDPGRLLFGDKLHSPALIPDWFLDTIKDVVDVILIQWYGPAEEQIPTLRRIHEATGKPILNGDSSFACADPSRQSGIKGKPVSSKTEAGRAYANYLDAIMKLPFMIGWHHCGIMEQWDGGKADPRFQNENGFLNPFEEPYPDFVTPMREANLRAHGLHEGAEILP